MKKTDFIFVMANVKPKRLYPASNSQMLQLRQLGIYDYLKTHFKDQKEMNKTFQKIRKDSREAKFWIELIEGERKKTH
jgi:hypothetical protein